MGAGYTIAEQLGVILKGFRACAATDLDQMPGMSECE